MNKRAVSCRLVKQWSLYSASFLAERFTDSLQSRSLLAMNRHTAPTNWNWEARSGGLSWTRKRSTLIIVSGNTLSSHSSATHTYTHPPALSPLSVKTSNLSKAHETRDSLEQFLFAGCPGLSPCISLQFAVKVCAAAENCRNITKTPISGVQGCSRSLMLNH